MFLLTGCGNISYTFPYNVNSNVSSFNVLAGTGTGKADAFASDLCVVTEDRMGDGSVEANPLPCRTIRELGIKCT